MRACIVGAGLGGLLAAANLAREGFKVEVFEKLPYPGGRFTNLPYRGYQLSTGALHMIPHAERGPLGKMLRQLGAGVEIIPSQPQAKFRISGMDYEYEELPSLFPLRDKLKVAKIIAMLKLGRATGEESYRSWLEKQIRNELVFKIADSFTGWSLSLKASEVPAKEVIAQTKNINKLGGPGIPAGGCGGVTKALVDVLQSEGAELHLKQRVKAIKQKGGAFEVLAEEKRSYDIVVSNAGPKVTAELARTILPEEYARAVSRIKGAAGIKISVACKKPMLGHSGVLFTPEAERINGINEVTNAVPELAPPGEHLLMSHQRLAEGADVKREIELGLRDLRELFPDFKKYCRVLAVQVYRNSWPVNRAPSGTHLSPATPVRGLYIVGDAVKPEGWMETDGIAAGVEEALRHIKASY